MGYMFDVKSSKGISSKENGHAIFSAKSKNEPGQFFQPNEMQEKPKNLTQGAYEQMTESEGLEKDIERNIARGTSRIGERILGLPGDIVNFIQDITGKKAGEFPLPTSGSLQEKSEKLSQGYTSPKNDLEEKSDELLGDIASMMIPGGGAYNMSRTIGIPLVGNLVQEGVKYLTKDEKKASNWKLGTMFILDLIRARRGMAPTGKGLKGALSTGGPQNYVSDLFRQSEQSIPQGARTSVPSLENSLRTIKQDMQQGGTAPSKTAALTKIDEALSVINNGEIDVSQLPAFRVSINEIIEQQGGWSMELPPKIRQRSIRNLGKVKKEIIKSGEDYGRTQNPEFLKNWTSANEAASVLGKSNAIKNLVQKNFGNKFASNSTKLLFGLGGTGVAVGSKFAPAATIGASALGGGLSSIYQGGKVLYRVAKSKTLRDYYSKTVRSALNGQKVEMIQNLAKLDKKLAEEEKKEKQLIEKLKKD